MTTKLCKTCKGKGYITEGKNTITSTECRLKGKPDQETRETRQLFNEKICTKNKCPKIKYIGRFIVYKKSFGNTVPTCFGNPEICKINQKAGYPKEIKKVKEEY